MILNGFDAPKVEGAQVPHGLPLIARLGHPQACAAVGVLDTTKRPPENNSTARL